MTVSMDAIVPLALALRQTTFTKTDWARDPRLQKAIRWLGAISTPPDPRLGGGRRMPEIGNTYTGERTCLTGWLARIYRESDPVFAKQMQWVWKQQGSYDRPGLGGLYPGVLGYAALVLDPAIPAEAPPWGSEWFPETGAVLRAHFPGPNETYMHYIQGRLHQHYDYDEGSFILWGKGAPLCEDFGYYGRRAAADHSRVDDGCPEAIGNEGKIREFLTSGRADYLHGERAGWHREILFAKDGDSLGPNYFFIRDSIRNGRAAEWRVWFATDAAPATDPARPARIAGRFDADLAVFLTQSLRRDALDRRVEPDKWRVGIPKSSDDTTFIASSSARKCHRRGCAVSAQPGADSPEIHRLGGGSGRQNRKLLWNGLRFRGARIV